MLRKTTIFLFLIFLFPMAPIVSKAALPDDKGSNDLWTLTDKSTFLAQASSSPQGEEKSFLQNALGGTFVGRILTGEPFERTGLVDILAAIFLAFIAASLVQHFKNKSSSSSPDKSGHFSGYKEDEDENTGPLPPPPGFDPWARLRSKPADKKDSSAPNPFAQEAGKEQGEDFSKQNKNKENPSQLPAGSTKGGNIFSEGEDSDFIKGAKILYSCLYEAEAEGDFDFIRHFSSDNAVEKHWKKRTKADYLSIVTVDAHVVSPKSHRGESEAVVEFRSLVHKNEQVGPPTQMAESWLLTLNENKGTWIFEKDASVPE